MIDKHPEILPALASLQTELIDARQTFCAKGWAHQGAREFRDSFGRIYCVLDGGGAVTHRGRLFELRPGYLFAIPAHAASRYRSHGAMTLLWLHYNAELLGGLEPFGFFGWDVVVKCDDARWMRAQWDRLLALRLQPDARSVLEADAILRCFLALFAGTRAGGDVGGEKTVSRFQSVFAYIDANLNGALSLNELARVMHLHPTYFSNVFSRSMGMTPIRYVNQRRIKRAEMLLLATGQTVKEIADAAGFNDAFYFSRVFKQHTGLSPTDYRQRKRSW